MKTKSIINPAMPQYYAKVLENRNPEGWGYREWTHRTQPTLTDKMVERLHPNAIVVYT